MRALRESTVPSKTATGKAASSENAGADLTVGVRVRVQPSEVGVGKSRSQGIQPSPRLHRSAQLPSFVAISVTVKIIHLPQICLFNRTGEYSDFRSAIETTNSVAQQSVRLCGPFATSHCHCADRPSPAPRPPRMPVSQRNNHHQPARTHLNLTLTSPSRPQNTSKASLNLSSLRRRPGLLRFTSSLLQYPNCAHSDRPIRPQLLGH